MAFKKLSSASAGKNKVDFKFVDYIEDEAQRDGSKLTKFILEKTIPLVTGRRVRDDVSGETVTLEATDVEIISVGQEALDEIEALQTLWEKEEADKVPMDQRKGEPLIDWTGDTSGTFSSKTLKFDVSSALDVWMVKTSLAQYGRNKRKEQNAQSKSAIMDRINANKAKRELKGAPAVTSTTKPNPAAVEK